MTTSDTDDLALKVAAFAAAQVNRLAGVPISAMDAAMRNRLNALTRHASAGDERSLLAMKVAAGITARALAMLADAGDLRPLVLQMLREEGLVPGNDGEAAAPTNTQTETAKPDAP